MILEDSAESIVIDLKRKAIRGKLEVPSSPLPGSEVRAQAYAIRPLCCGGVSMTTCWQSSLNAPRAITIGGGVGSPDDSLCGTGGSPTVAD